ncbi:hypothetical protein K1719_001228 [Acacia pycnantha]|nr:hypothetical protein K1719_001228 [Acacia pycnantha]
MELDAKEDAPPPSADSLRSTKKVRLRSEEGESREGNGLTGSDTGMKQKDLAVGISYKDKLLKRDGVGWDHRESEDVVVTEGDYLISKEGDILSINLSENVRKVLVGGMTHTLVIKLLGRSIFYGELLQRTQALWQLKGSYQLVDMNVASTSLLLIWRRTTLRVAAWARIPSLSFRYYHKSTLCAIGKLLGEVVKIDYLIESRGRGRYARIAIMLDLEQPLVPWIRVDGRTYGVEYEGLPLICFTCGKYSHNKEKCHGEVQSSSATFAQRPGANPADSPRTPAVEARSDSAGGRLPEPGAPLYGLWMQVRYPQKGNKQHWGREAKIGGLH